MKRTCCNCGEPIDEGMAFCRKCGTRVAENASETPAQTPLQQNCQPRGGNNLKRTCNNCGEPVGDGMAFCRKCGTCVAENTPEIPEQKTPPEKTQGPSAEAEPEMPMQTPPEEAQAPSAEAEPEMPAQTPPGELQAPFCESENRDTPEENQKTFKEMTFKEKVLTILHNIIALIVLGLIGYWLFNSCYGVESNTEDEFIQYCEENGFDTDSFTVEEVNLVESEQDSNLYKGTIKLRMEDGSFEEAEVVVWHKMGKLGKWIHSMTILKSVKLPPTLLKEPVKTLFVQICEDHGFDTDSFSVEEVNLVESGKGSGHYKGIVKLRMEDGDVENAEVEVTDSDDEIYVKIIKWPPAFWRSRLN